MENKRTDMNELSEKVLQGIRKALRKLAETSAANNEDLIVADKNGQVRAVPAKKLLRSISR